MKNLHGPRETADFWDVCEDFFCRLQDFAAGCRDMRRNAILSSRDRPRVVQEDSPDLGTVEAESDSPQFPEVKVGIGSITFAG